MDANINAYEVIRIINSKTLFLLDHFQRLQNTISSSFNFNISLENLEASISKIVNDNSISDGNIRIDIFYNGIENKTKFSVKQIPHNYPTIEQYITGVKTCTIEKVRERPNKKIWNENLRVEVNNLIKQRDVYEVLYIDNNNCLTEGSRSNLFFIKGNKLVSAPSKNILLGITRKYIIETAELLEMEILEMDISNDIIYDFDAAFISGTSPKILPINSIDKTQFNVENKFLRDLMLQFDKTIENHLIDNK